MAILLTWLNDDGTAAGQCIPDASEREQHDVSAEVTRHQVEKGPDVTDHIRPLPRKVTIDFLVSNTPITTPLTQSSGTKGTLTNQQLLAGKNDVQVKYSALAFDRNFNRVVDAYDDLCDAILAGQLFTLTTSLHRYASMAVTSLTTQRDVENANVLRATMALEELRIVETQNVKALPGKAVKKRGAIAPKEAKEADKPRLQSSFHKLAHG